MELHKIIYLQGVARNLVRLAEKNNDLSALEAESLKSEFAEAAETLLKLMMEEAGK